MALLSANAYASPDDPELEALTLADNMQRSQKKPATGGLLLKLPAVTHVCGMAAMKIASVFRSMSSSIKP
jgi:NO-binding membrane sensor protein with MHYT domain